MSLSQFSNYCTERTPCQRFALSKLAAPHWSTPLFFIAVRTQNEIYPLNKLLSAKYSIINYRHNVQQSSKTF